MTESVSDKLSLFNLASETAISPLDLDKKQEDQCQVYYEQQIAKPDSPAKKVIDGYNETKLRCILGVTPVFSRLR